ncbi:hypothetical protein [Nocardiopsis alborubida]|uniref:hypothetical protein n=1 Tax=Nocardiopsis alborubida TaxID=146802 RepID=UPI00076E4320|nr:hypothetical protein [Nocardiopsis alborubida]
MHEQVLLEARARAEADGRVTSTELRELERAAKNPGAGHVIQDLLYVADQEKARRNGLLKGWRVVPVGEDGSVNAVVDFAVSHGATVGVNVTKTVRLVIAEPGTDDAKVRRAREADIRVATPAEAWDLLKAAVDKAEHGREHASQSRRTPLRSVSELGPRSFTTRTTGPRVPTTRRIGSARNAGESLISLSTSPSFPHEPILLGPCPETSGQLDRSAAPRGMSSPSD